MFVNQYTKEELLKLPLQVLKNLDVRSGEEQELLQEAVNARVRKEPPAFKMDVIVPDIRDGETEAKWQKIIDDKKADYVKKLTSTFNLLDSTSSDSDKLDEPKLKETIIA